MRKQKEITGSRTIRCHKELLEILDGLKKPINDFTWGALADGKISWETLTLILAKKIKNREV